MAPTSSQQHMLAVCFVFCLKTKNQRANDVTPWLQLSTRKYVELKYLELTYQCAYVDCLGWKVLRLTSKNKTLRLVVETSAASKSPHKTKISQSQCYKPIKLSPTTRYAVTPKPLRILLTESYTYTYSST